VEARIRKKLLDDGNIDTVIGLPANLFYSTGIPVCILVLKKINRPSSLFEPRPASLGKYPALIRRVGLVSSAMQKHFTRE